MADPKDVRFYGAVVLGVAAVSVAVVLSARRPKGPPLVSPTSPAAPAVAWCARGLEPIAGGGCFAAPARTPAPLVVYLHGRHADETLAEELARQARVARLGTSRGFAVLALRGKRGECTDPQLASFWCWPSNEKNAVDGAKWVAEWEPAIAEAERRAGRSRRHLLGFSNGGYFAVVIATRGLLPFDAVAVAHAGPVEPTVARGAKPPMLLVTADDDPSNDEMMRLDAELARAEWPHHIVARGGGHELPDEDVQWALAFFARAEGGRLPPAPGGHAPRHKESMPEGGEPDAATEADAAITASPAAGETEP
ncbi:MAG TPA: PHB depolymerase family esterase [Labilithrix sp.]